MAVVVLTVGMILVLPLRRELDALLVGEDIARNTGVNTVRIKWILILVSTLLTAVLVSMSGAIGFVGFVIPHIARGIVGAAHKRLISFSILLGAIFMVWATFSHALCFRRRNFRWVLLPRFAAHPYFYGCCEKADIHSVNSGRA